MSLTYRLLSLGFAAHCVFACAESDSFDRGHAGTGGSTQTSLGGRAAGGFSQNASGGNTSAQTGGSIGSGGASFGGATRTDANGGSAAPASGGVAAVPERANIVLYHQSDVSDVTTNRIFMRLFIENRSPDPLPLADVKVHYFMTSEVALPGLHSYYVGSSVSGETLSFVEAGAQSHIEIGFTGGTILAGADLSQSEFQIQIDGGTFVQSNDYSFNPADTERQPNQKITVYLAGRLIWGCEPGGACLGTGGGEGGAGGMGGAGGADGAGGAGGEAGSAVGGSGGDGSAGAGGSSAIL